MDQAAIETQILCRFGQGGKVGFGLWTRRYQGNHYSNDRVSLAPMSVCVSILFIQTSGYPWPSDTVTYDITFSSINNITNSIHNKTT